MKYFFPILVGTLATLLPSAIAEKVCTPCSPGDAFAAIFVVSVIVWNRGVCDGLENGYPITAYAGALGAELRRYFSPTLLSD
ncbi:hypothetical protein PTT_15666 [Pyrenophora teres f. teres 0-1]|uniref:Uncharacterized protein n=1 Tax=Pyrenophora teres f. teres (strain 0-1) TaxID=861557 RepID=E3S0P6_PYRTT|nr:hypothetical protein PTT_15666 [Pyrenophora teres f. teres 0-1]